MILIRSHLYWWPLIVYLNLRISFCLHAMAVEDSVRKVERSSVSMHSTINYIYLPIISTTVKSHWYLCPKTRLLTSYLGCTPKKLMQNHQSLNLGYDVWRLASMMINQDMAWLQHLWWVDRCNRTWPIPRFHCKLNWKLSRSSPCDKPCNKYKKKQQRKKKYFVKYAKPWVCDPP